MIAVVRLDPDFVSFGQATVVEIVKGWTDESPAVRVGLTTHDAFEKALLKYNDDPNVRFWDVPQSVKEGNRLSLMELGELYAEEAEIKRLQRLYLKA